MGAKYSSRNHSSLGNLSVAPGQRISNLTDVSLRIASHVSSTEAKDSNLVMSPLLIHAALCLIAAGSDGPTRAQLMSFLRSDSVDDLSQVSSELINTVLFDGGSDLKLAFANGVWIDQSLTLKPAFKHTVEDVYKAAAKQIDFQTKANEATGEVNSWAEKMTNGLIKQLLPPGSVEARTRIIFTNALYFKGSWNQKFDPSRTHHSDFHLLNGSSVQAPFMMMPSSAGQLFISAFEGFKSCRLPYKKPSDNRQFSMYIFLPDAKDGLPNMAKKLTTPGFLERHLPNRQVEFGMFKIPKFKISFGHEVSNALKQLGVGTPFATGGLTGMVESDIVGRELCVSSIFHKAFIEVNEEGTEASAATAATVLTRALPVGMDFVADHPFMFIIREDRSGVVLFVGHIFNPLAPAGNA